MNDPNYIDVPELGTEECIKCEAILSSETYQYCPQCEAIYCEECMEDLNHTH